MITPVLMPEPVMARQMSVELERFQSTPDGGGAGQTVTYGDPRWTCSIPFSGFPDRASQDEWKAFAGKLDGIRVPALVWDHARQVPRGALDGAGRPVPGSPWGEPTYQAHSRADSTFDLMGFTPGWDLYAGDYFSLQNQDGIWRLFRLLDDVTPDASGNVTAHVEPRPERGLTLSVGASIRMRKALCQMVLRFPRGAFAYGANNGVGFTVEGTEVPRVFV